MAQTQSRQVVVESLLRKIQKGQDFPAFSEHINQVMQVVEDDESSMRNITGLILKDVSLTTNVLRTANSAHYNRSGRRLDTVTHAVSLLGLNAIRDLASSMLMLQHFWGKSAGTKELLLMSLLTAAHARGTARLVKYTNIEEAYLCGMFRNLGEILVSGYMPRKYAAILKRIEEFAVDEHSAAFRVLECDYEDLGRGASRLWKMPDRVRHSMQNGQMTSGRSIAGELDVLRTIVSFSHGLTEAVHRYDPTAAGGRLNDLIMGSGGLLPFDRDTVQQIVEEGIEETKSTFDLLHIPFDDLRLRKQTEAAMAALERRAQEEPGESHPEPLEPGAEMLEQLTEEVELAFCSGEGRDLNRMLGMILDVIARGAPFDRVLFGLVTPDHRSVRGRLGKGKYVDSLIDSFQFPLSIRSGPVAVALLGKQDLFVHDGRYSNTDFGRTVRTTNFGLMPVVVGAVPLGVFYFDRKPGAPAPSDGIIHQLTRLRNLATETIEVSRRGAPKN